MPNDAPNSKRTIVAAACAVAAVGAVVAFALFVQPAAPTTREGKFAIASPTPDSAESLSPSSVQENVKLPPAPAPRVSGSAGVPAMAAQAGPEAPQWEAQIDNVLRSSTNESQTAQILLQMLPALPEDGQIEAANHIANLLPDADYRQLKPVLLNPATSEPVLAVFFTDLMNRDDATKLRIFLDISKVPNHPYRDEALSDLQIYVGEDYGTDWVKWNAAVEKYLKAASAEAAP